MSLEVKVPPVGESITQVIVANWLKADGDYVEQDEAICELESDKATFEANAETSGILRIKAEEGDELEIGAVLCVIEEGSASETPKETVSESTEEVAAPEASEGEGGLKKTGEVIEMKVPTVGESINSVTIGVWSKESGDFVEHDEIIAEIESDKATFELNAEASGILHIVAEEGTELEIGELICKIEVAEGAPAAKADAPQASASGSSTDSAPANDGKTSHAEGHPSPAAAKILQEKGIDPADVKGTGPGGRITKEDALKAKKAEKKQAPAASAKAQAPTQEAPKTPGSREQRREKMTSLRRTIAKRLVTAKNETAMLTTFNEVDMKPVMDTRKKYKEAFKKKYDVGLGFMSFFTKAVCIALQEFEAVNGYIDGNEIVYNDFCDISIAVSSPRGLVVPVIRNAESLSFDGIEKEVVRLAVKARDGKLTIPEMTGGTFTITNGGIFGSMLSTPIINIPQSAILGMHNIVQRPVAVNGQVEIRPIMYLALSYDHRIIDGKESVSFLYRIKELLEDPARMLLDI